MLRNNMFNLVNQLTQESKSLWRIKNIYMQEAVGSDDMMNLWKKIQTDTEEHVLALEAAIKKGMAKSDAGAGDLK